MTLEEKIEHLKTATMEEARAQGNAIIREHSDALERIFNEHKESALRQAELTLKSEITNARQERNKAMAKSQIDLKRKLGKCQTDLKNKLFSRVRELTEEYMLTEAYDALLEKHIKNALDFARGADMTIYINLSDEAKKARLEALTGAALTVSKEDFFGGMRAVIHDRHILIDNSFSSLLQEEYDKFLFLGGGVNA